MAKKKGYLETAGKGELMTLRILLIILGLMLLLMGLYFIILLPLAVLSFYLAHKCKQELKRRKIPVEPVEVVKEPVEAVRDTVMVTDLDGSVNEVSTHLTIDHSDRVLVVDGGKSYHTHLSCFKNWNTDNFTGWKIIKKSEALAGGMKYCSFCKELDFYEDDDLEESEE